MRYIVCSIPHRMQRYPTVGDWIARRGHLAHVRVSEMENEDYAFLAGMHEQIEAWLCLKRGITQEIVDQFDLAFERERADGNVDEPGSDPRSPYRREHVFAEHIERQLAEELGVDWKAYETAVMGL